MTEAERFFYDHAGYATPPGREQCARELAAAELWARDHIRFDWIPDDDADLSWADRETLEDIEAGRYEVLGCIAYRQCEACEHENHVASLWNLVVGADDPYRRVVEAELAAEVMAA